MVQHRQFRGEMGDPHGRGLMDFLGTGNEARAHLIGVIEDVLDKNANRKTYIPTNSILQSKAHLLPFMTYVPINPGGEPKTEDLIPVPQEAINLYEIVNKEMDDASGLQEAGQGLNSPNVKSGRQALTIVSQVHAGLSDLKQNAERAFVRSCRIQLQLVGNSFTDPQILRFQGPDGSYKVKRWMGSDLGSSRDVRIKPGTMTMMSPLQKTQIALQYSQYGMLPPDELKDVITANIGGTIGLQDDPHLQRVRRQIEAWRKGPPADFPEEPQIDPMTGMQASLPLESTRQPVPADAIPTVAQLRLREIGKEMASTRFTNAKPLWQGVLTDLFVQAQMALQPPPQAPPGGPGEEKKPPEDVGTQKPEATQGQPPELQQGEADVLPEVI
ncbi:MAG: hypothetical protein E4G90_10335 [Gemmatimonadales bacterium]|nr:MAG: hypothetical protein E4G90_10335 [Gemmatimonadales bacterium]